MEMIADTLLVAGALGAGFYCYVLARRLNRFNDLENGVGGAVAILSAQVDDLTRTLDAAKHTASTSTDSLEALTDRAANLAKRLELLMASMHDLPDPEPPASRLHPRSVPSEGPVFRRNRPIETGVAQ